MSNEPYIPTPADEAEYVISGHFNVLHDEIPDDLLLAYVHSYMAGYRSRVALG